MANKISKEQEKLCNICGELTLVYTVVDNAPLCKDCMPIKQMKKLKSEAQMVQTILGGEKK
jgi:formylmethanofuran dehydrogenase subunit E